MKRIYSLGLLAICVGRIGNLSAQEMEVYRPSVLRSIETRYDSIDAFHKWTSMLERKLEQEPDLNSDGCRSGPFEACGPYYWRSFVAETKAADALAKIQKVQDYVNQFKYVTDFQNWGVSDFWETPLEFLEKMGDCEDFAITKYVTLKRLGFDAQQMRILVVQDLNLRIGHAVLLLDYKGRHYILDNQIKFVVEAADIAHYRAIYSINETSWWKHIYRETN